MSSTSSGAPRYVVVVGRAATDALAGARQRIDEHPEIAALGPMSVLWAVLDAVIADGERVADLLIDEGVDIEQGVFGGDHDQSQPIYEHERRVEQVARVVRSGPPAIFDTLERGERVQAPDRVRPLLKRCGRPRPKAVRGASRCLSGRLDALLSANLARATVRQNVIVQKVSAWGAIAVVPTIITGIYGMNFRRFPELGWAFGYPFALVVMILAVLVLRWRFRRAGWL